MNKPFSRRDAFGLIALTAAGAAVGVTRSVNGQNSQPRKKIANAGTYQFSVGNFQLTILSDGYGAFPVEQPMWAPEATARELQQALADDFLPLDQLSLSFNPVLIDNGKDLLLCDTGSGKLLLPTTGRLLQQLQLAGYEPDQVTGVFLSHAHIDHLGGLLTEDSRPVFSSAQHFVHDREWAFWTDKDPDFSKQRLDEKTKGNFVQLAQKTFGTLEKNFHRVAPGTSLIDGVVVEAAPGHTPGHTTLRIRSDKQELVHIFDLAHHPTIMFKHPAWTVAFDTDEALAAATRKNLFSELATSRTRVLGYHLPFPGIGHIAKDGAGYRWVPAAWQQA